MFSPSALGGSVCLRCQIRAVTRRAPPLLAAAPVRGRRRQYASDATSPRPEDVPPAFEIREHDRRTEKSPGESRPSQSDKPSPSVIPEQTLSGSPQDTTGDARGLPDRSAADDNNHDAIERHAGSDQISRADFHPVESAPTSEPGHRIQDSTSARKTNQIKNSSVGQAQLDPASTAARRDDHTTRGCASLKPPRDLECPNCGNSFGTKKLLHRHLAKSSCSGRAKSQKLAGKESGRNVADILTRAAAAFSRSQAAAAGKLEVSDDWDLPRREDVRLQAARADRDPLKSTGQGAAAGVEDNVKSEPETQDEKTSTADKNSTSPKRIAGGCDVGNERRAEEGSPVVLIRRIGKVDRSTSGWKKRHRRGDMLLVEDASKLGIESLGKAAEVIVLRDGRQWERRARPVAASSEETTDDALKIEDWLEEQDILSLDDVMKNIHGLKPERRIVSAREYKSLFNTLFDGFTIAQLEKYVVWHREQPILETIKDEVFGKPNTASEESAMPADVSPGHRHYGWMTEEAHWTPCVDGAVEDAQYPLAGYIMKSMPPKQRLVVQLVRECWDISIQELLNGNGRIDIRVRDLEFKLLTRKYITVSISSLAALLTMNVPVGSQSWLRNLSRRFLKEGQQIEVRRSSNLIRITAPKTVAETCVNRLDDALQKTKTSTLDLDRIPMRHLDAPTLEKLGEITNSIVHFSPGRKAVGRAIGPHSASGWPAR